jgi:hypothetical protein
LVKRTAANAQGDDKPHLNKKLYALTLTSESDAESAKKIVAIDQGIDALFVEL